MYFCGMCLIQFAVSRSRVFLSNSTSSVSLSDFSLPFCEVLLRNCFWPLKLFSLLHQKSKTCDKTSRQFKWYSSFICSKCIRMFLCSKWIVLTMSHCLLQRHVHGFQFCFQAVVFFPYCLYILFLKINTVHKSVFWLMFKTKSLATFNLVISYIFFYLLVVRHFFPPFFSPSINCYEIRDGLKYGLLGGICCKLATTVINACVAKMGIFAL